MSQEWSEHDHEAASANENDVREYIIRTGAIGAEDFEEGVEETQYGGYVTPPEEAARRELLSEKIKTRIWPTLSDYGRKLLKHDPLFKKMVAARDAEEFLNELRRRGTLDDEYDDMLITGFGLRNSISLENALRADERRRLLELYARHLKEERDRLEGRIKDDIISEATASTAESFVTTETPTQTEETSGASDSQKRLAYLLGLETTQDEEEGRQAQPLPTSISQIEDEEPPVVGSKGSRAAQKYLRSHRVLEFLNFLATHLLSSAPDDPIDFLLNLLNKCLMYRSGLGDPPLLYSKNHAAQLFKLMDRLGAGVIEYDQYVTGMKTLGICSYEKYPQNSDSEGRMPVEGFVDEVYDAELALFDDMIKRRKKVDEISALAAAQASRRSSTATVSLVSDRGPYFIPSALYRFDKKSDQIPPSFEEG